MNRATLYLRRFNDIWLLSFCLATLPWGGVIFAVPMLLTYALLRKRESFRLQLSMAAGSLSLCYMLRPLWDFHCWKQGGHYDAQESLFYLFLFGLQTILCAVCMLVTYGICTGARNLRESS